MFYNEISTVDCSMKKKKVAILMALLKVHDMDSERLNSTRYNWMRTGIQECQAYLKKTHVKHSKGGF